MNWRRNGGRKDGDDRGMGRERKGRKGRGVEEGKGRGVEEGEWRKGRVGKRVSHYILLVSGLF